MFFKNNAYTHCIVDEIHELKRKITYRLYPAKKGEKNMALQKVKNEIEAVYNKELSRVEESTKEIQRLKEERNALVNSLDDAKNISDVKCYGKIKQDIDSINTIIEMHEKILADAKKKPFINPEATKEYAKKVRQALDQYNADVISTLLPELEAIITKYEDVNSTLVEGEKLLTLLKDDAFKGRVFISDTYNDWTTHYLLKDIKNHHILKGWQEKRKEEV